MARKILLADDSVTAQNMGRKILADAGYEVIAVNNGSAALKKIAELKPDLVVLDVYMPGYSGLEVCQRLKENPDTARIPVLLTVGKLEPFKPEEAQRVRAEGFIVKPFEASELLSALSKLEDKVVPRAEPSKPGRFARAIAAADEQDNDRSKEPSRTESGWKNRISFPINQSGAEEAAVESESENEKISPRKGKRSQSSSSAAESVDISAFAPIGIPKDVTPSEVAAITAAAAQIQKAEAGTRDEQKTSAPETSGASEFSVEPSLGKFQESSAEENQASSGIEARQPELASREPEAATPDPAKPGVSSVLAARADNNRIGGEKSGESQDAPVTMAAATETVADANSGPRWTAVPVSLASDETAVSLEHEMQKAYAAFAAADYATSAGTASAESAADNSSWSSAAAETPSQPQTEPVSESHAKAVSETAFSSAEAATEPAQLTETAATSNFSAIEPEEAVETQKTESQSAESFSGAASAPATETPAVYTVPSTEGSAADSESVKTTAAAWASWRQVRDTDKNDAEPASSELRSEPVTPEPVSQDTAALAVAAGAEQAAKEATAVAPSENPTDVASIVDSVLAGLRPKLMEEITRKMSEKK